MCETARSTAHTVLVIAVPSRAIDHVTTNVRECGWSVAAQRHARGRWPTSNTIMQADLMSDGAIKKERNQMRVV